MSKDRQRGQRGKHPRSQRSGERRKESGVPGGGAGRTDEVGGSGVYPASAGQAPADSEIHTQMGWGQGDRGPAGYYDSGSSELNIPNPDLQEEEKRDRKRKGNRKR